MTEQYKQEASRETIEVNGVSITMFHFGEEPIPADPQLEVIGFLSGIEDQDLLEKLNRHQQTVKNNPHTRRNWEPGGIEEQILHKLIEADMNNGAIALLLKRSETAVSNKKINLKKIDTKVSSRGDIDELRRKLVEKVDKIAHHLRGPGDIRILKEKVALLVKVNIALAQKLETFKEGQPHETLQAELTAATIEKDVIKSEKEESNQDEETASVTRVEKIFTEQQAALLLGIVAEDKSAEPLDFKSMIRIAK